MISSFGYSKSTLKSNNAIIPIAYYLLKIGLPKNYITSSKTIADRISIKKWLNRSLVKKVFSGQPDNVLRQIREIIRNNNNEFPYNEILNKFRGTNNTIVFTEEDIEENILQLQYSKSDTLPSLMFIYPGFDQSMSIYVDHIYPKSLFIHKELKKRGLDKEDIQYYLDNIDGIANLQLLMKIPNIEKQNKEFKHWLNETSPSKEAKNSYMDLQYIPDVNFDFTNFREFYESRKEKLKQAFINELI